MIFSKSHTERSAHLLNLARVNQVTIVTAESCTGGLIGACLTEIPGASDVFERGFITYTNAAKEHSLGVSADLIAHHGAVSAQVAKAMAEGALAHSPASLSIAVTGVAGPGGGTAQKPVGMVHLASAFKGGETLLLQLTLGDIGRDQIRMKSVEEALLLALQHFDN